MAPSLCYHITIQVYQAFLIDLNRPKHKQHFIFIIILSVEKVMHKKELSEGEQCKLI